MSDDKYTVGRAYPANSKEMIIRPDEGTMVYTCPKCDTAEAKLTKAVKLLELIDAYTSPDIVKNTKHPEVFRKAMLDINADAKQTLEEING